MPLRITAWHVTWPHISTVISRTATFTVRRSTRSLPDTAEGAVEVEVADLQGAPRYCGLTIRGVKVAESPEWLRNRLETIGVRSINNVVDITNYILHGIGQPPALLQS